MKRKLAIMVVIVASVLGLTACDSKAPVDKTAASVNETSISIQNDGENTPSMDSNIIGKTEWYHAVASSARAWEIEIDYKEKWTEVTVKHNTLYCASYDAGKRPSGEPNYLSVYDMATGSGDPQKLNANVVMKLSWEGDILCLYLSELDGFTPTDEDPWQINGTEFELYDEAY